MNLSLSSSTFFFSFNHINDCGDGSRVDLSTMQFSIADRPHCVIASVSGYLLCMLLIFFVCSIAEVMCIRSDVDIEIACDDRNSFVITLLLVAFPINFLLNQYS